MSKRNMLRCLLAFLSAATCTIALLAPATPALAASYTGAMKGRILYYEYRYYAAQPGDGAVYLTADKYTWRGVPHAKIYLLDKNGNVVGTAKTDGTGSFNVSWTSSSSSPSLHAEFRYESGHEKNGTPRFRFVTTEGGKWVSALYSGYKTGKSGQTVDIGNRYLGTKANPHKLSNMFATAANFLTNVGTASAYLWEYMAGVNIHFPYPSAKTGATYSRTKIGMPDSGYAFNNSTMAHELGHVVNMLAWERDSLDYSCIGGHSWNSAETESCAFGEGWANFVAAATFFYPSAKKPTSYGYDIEGETCTGDAEKTESNVARYFWDVYDSTHDASASQPLWWFFDKLNFFPKGTNNRQDGENKSDSTKGTNVWDFYYHGLYGNGGEKIDTAALVYHNCLESSAW
ncbi:MAG: hypothetical protein HYV63_01760 [Candidatus Schekmanbacteria bacterium]|nr:hypothetical protein [Candidatus Schekmanbacteria bacterium]